MTITPRIGVSAIEFIRSKDGSEEKLVETVSLEVVTKAMNYGWQHGGWRDHEYSTDDVLTILRQEAEK